MRVDRRTFLKGAALASAAAVAPAGLAATAAARAAAEPVWHRAPCTLCGVGCGLLVAIRGGRAIAVKGDVESSTGRGLACIKGYHAIHALYGRDRITRPLVRRNGTLVETTLEEAWNAIAVRLRDTIAQHGADSVGVCGSGQWSVTDAYVAAKLCKGGIGTNNVDTDTRLYSASGSTALRSTFGLDGSAGCYDDIENADVFVLWGHNMAETDPVLFSRLLERRRTNPAALIIDVGSRTTRTSYAADRSLLHAPHAEITLANAICHELVQGRSVNRDFVDRHVTFARGESMPGYGLDEQVIAHDDIASATYAEYVRFLADYAPERAAQLAGIGADDIRWMASLYGDRARKVLSLWGSELNQHVRGTWTNNALHNIHLLVGKVASPGNGAMACTAQPSGADAVHAAGASPDALPRGTVGNVDDRQFAARTWGVPVERIAARPGRSAVALFRGLEGGAVRFLWVQSANPLVSLPNSERYRRAAAADSAFLVVTDAYHTASTAVADVVLPAALWLEREGLYGNGERRTQHCARLLRAPGEATPDSWHMIEVARRMGLAALFPWQEATHVEEAWTEYMRFLGRPSHRPASLAELRAQPGLLWPFVDGRETKWRYSTAHDPAADAGNGTFDFYGYDDHRARIWLRPHSLPPEAPDGEYPLWLVTGSVLEHAGTGTFTSRIPALHRAAPRAYVELNRDDARDLRVRDGERVRLVTRRGALVLEARIDFRSQPPRGQVFVPVFDEATPINRLTPDACCPLSGQPGYGRCAVRVESIPR
jgi:nitrate reductase (cytochrome)